MGHFASRPVPGPKGDFAVPEIPKMFAKYPTVWEYVTTQRYEDGKPRKGSKIALFWADGTFKVNLNDEDGKQGAYYSGESWEACLASLEKHLAAGSVMWRAWKK